MAGFASNDTQYLTQASLELVASRARRRSLLAVGLAIVLALTAAFAIRQGGPLGLANLREHNLRLQADIERTSLELRMERATRAELERQIEELNRRITELNQRLEFLNSRAGRKSATAQPARMATGRQQG